MNKIKKISFAAKVLHKGSTKKEVKMRKFFKVVFVIVKVFLFSVVFYSVVYGLSLLVLGV